MTAYSTLEEDVFIAPCVVTTNDNFMGRTEQRKALMKGPTIRRGARVGGGAILCPGIEIGEEAFVGAGAVVTKDVPARKRGRRLAGARAARRRPPTSCARTAAEPAARREAVRRPGRARSSRASPRGSTRPVRGARYESRACAADPRDCATTRSARDVERCRRARCPAPTALSRTARSAVRRERGRRAGCPRCRWTR